MMRRLFAATLLLVGCQDTAPPPRANLDLGGAIKFTATAWPEADLLFHRDPRWLGSDAAFSVDLGNERVLWLFGDTFIAASEHHVRRESHMVRNSVAVQRGLDPSRAEINFFWKQDPASWFPEQGEEWFWPQHGVRIPGGPLILFWSRVHATPNQGLGFMADGWACVLVDNPDDSPEQWKPRALEPALLPAGILPAQGLFIEGDFMYGIAIREPGDHAGYALRIAVDALRRGDLGSLELWNGHWTRASECAGPSVVLADAAPEMSLHFSAKLGKYVHVRSLGFGATALVLETSDRITGPWSEPIEVYRPPESDRKDAFVYAGKAHPELLGADIIATYASNSFDFGKLVSDTTLYYPRFVRINCGR